MSFSSRFRNYFKNWLSGKKKQIPWSKRRRKSTLLVELLEDRTVMSTLPAAHVGFDNAPTLETLGDGIRSNSISPTVIVDPLDSHKLVEVHSSLRRDFAGAPASWVLQVNYSVDEGRTWSWATDIAAEADPSLDNQLFAQITDPHVAFDRNHHFYVVSAQHGVAPANGVPVSGALVFQRFDFSNTVPVQEASLDAVSQVHQINLLGVGGPFAGTFTLAFGGDNVQFTGTPTAAQVQSALNTMPSMQTLGGTVEVVRTVVTTPDAAGRLINHTIYKVTFGGGLAGMALPGGGLSGFGGGAITVNTFNGVVAQPDVEVNLMTQGDDGDGNVILYRWFQTDPAAHPVIGIDTNVPSFTDPVTGLVQTDTMATMVAINDPIAGPDLVPKGIYVAWSADTAMTQLGGAQRTPQSRIFVAASADGGRHFTTQQLISDPLNANGEQDAANPQIVFTQGRAAGPGDPGIPGGQMLIFYNDFYTGINGIKYDSSQPDNGVASQPVAATRQFSNTGALGILDALPQILSPDDIPQTTPNTSGLTPVDFSTPATIFVDFSPAATDINSINLTSITDLDVTINVVHPNLNQLLVVLAPPPGSSLPSIPLVLNRVDEFGLANNPPDGLPAGQNLGEIQVAGTDQRNGTVFDDDASRPITEGSANAPYVGHFIAEGGSFDTLIALINASPGLRLANGPWTLVFADFRDSGAPNQFLDGWSMNFTGVIDAGNFGADASVGPTINPNGVPGAPLNVYPTATLAAPGPGVNSPGIGPLYSVTIDNTLGSFSPFQGRVYIASTQFVATPFASAPFDVNNTDIVLFTSDNVGAGNVWTDPTRLNPIYHRVNNDALTDQFSDGNRAQFQPQVAVDPVTGTLGVSYYDGRYDAAGVRVANSFTTSVDGGATFAPPVFLNTKKTALDFYNQEQVFLEPVPNNMTVALPANAPAVEAAARALGFGDRSGLAMYGGRVYPAWSGNLNTTGSQIFTNTVTVAGGPRLVPDPNSNTYDMGPVVADFTAQGNTYNNTFTADNTRQLDGFVVTFDRPVDAALVDPGDFHLTYRDPNGSPVEDLSNQIQSVTAIDNTVSHGPHDLGTLTTISVSDAIAQEPQEGTTELEFTVSLSHAYHTVFALDYYTQDGTATSLGFTPDYVAVQQANPGKVTFLVGETRKTFKITLLSDIVPIAEGSKFFLVNMTGLPADIVPAPAPAATAPAPLQAKGTIVGNANVPTPAITVANAFVREGDPIIATVTFPGTGTALFSYAGVAAPTPLTLPTTPALLLAHLNSIPALTGTVAVTGGGSGIFTILALPGFVSTGDLTATGSATVVPGPAGSINPQMDFNVFLNAPVNFPVSLDFNWSPPPVAGVPGSAISGGTAFLGTNFNGIPGNTTVRDGNGNITYTVDYNAATNTGRLTMQPGTSVAKISATIVSDQLATGNKFFFLNLVGAVQASVARTQAAGVIVDDDALRVSIGDVTVQRATTTQVLDVPIYLNGPTSRDVTGTFSTVLTGTGPGDAQPITDFTAQSNVAFLIPAGSQSTTLKVPITAGTVPVGNKTFRVQLDTVQNAAKMVVPASDPLATASSLVTILDSTVLPDITVGDGITGWDPRTNTASGTREGDAGATTVYVPVYLTFATPTDITLPYRTVAGSGTATAGADYTAIQGGTPSARTLVIPAGQRVGYMEVAILGDTEGPSDAGGGPVFAPPDNETFQVQIDPNFFPANATISRATGNVTIVEDDVTLTVGDTMVRENSTTATSTSVAFVEVFLSGPHERPITVDLTTLGNGDAGANPGSTAQGGADFTPFTRTITFAPGVTRYVDPASPPGQFGVPITILHNAAQQNATPRTFEVRASNMRVGQTTATGLIQTANGVVSIVNSDAATPALWHIGNVAAHEGQGAVNIPIFVDTPFAQAETILVTTNGGGAVVQDLNNFAVTLAAGRNTPATLPQITLVDNPDKQANRTFTVQLVISGTPQSPTGGTVQTRVATFTIVDDDATTVTLGSGINWEGNDPFQTTDFVFPAVVSNAVAPFNTQGTYGTVDGAITAASFTTPIVITTALNHGLATGNQVTITGVRGNLGANGTFTITVTNPNTFTLLGSQGNGTYTGGGTWTLVPAAGAQSGALANVDYTPVALNAQFTNSAGANSVVQLHVGVIGDALPERTEFFTGAITSGSSPVRPLLVNPVNPNEARGTGIIVDDDALNLTVGDTSAQEGNGANFLDFIVYLNGATGVDVPFDWTLTDGPLVGGAVRGVDYQEPQGANPPGSFSGSAVITARNLSTFIRVPLAGRPGFQGNRTFTMSIASTSGAASVRRGTGTGTIMEDDLTPTLTISDAAVRQPGIDPVSSVPNQAPAVFDVFSDFPIQAPINFTATPTSLLATAPEDFVAAAQVGTIAGSATQTTVAVQVLGSATPEGNETFRVTLSNAGTNQLAPRVTDQDVGFPGLGIGTIVETLTVPSINIGDLVMQEGDLGTTSASITLIMSTPSPVPMFIRVDTIDGTATAANGDYLPIANRLVTIPAGTATFVVDNVTIINNSSKDALRNFFVKLSNAQFATIGKDLATVTIVDNDSTLGATQFLVEMTPQHRVGTYSYTVGPNIADRIRVPFVPGATLSVGDITVAEGAGTANFTLFLSAPSQQVITVQVNTGGGNAVPGGDYTAVSQVVTINPGTTSQLVSVPLIGNGTADPLRTFNLTASAMTVAGNPAPASIARAVGTASLIDDDNNTATFWTINDVTASEGDPSPTSVTKSFTFTISTNQPFATDQTIPVFTSGATPGADYLPFNTPVSLPAGATSVSVTILVIPNQTEQLNRTFSVQLGTPTAGVLGQKTVGRGIIIDDDPSSVVPTVPVAWLGTVPENITVRPFAAVLDVPINTRNLQPNSPPTVATSTLTVSGIDPAEVLRDLTVTVDVNFPETSFLDVLLTAPGGQQFVLSSFGTFGVNLPNIVFDDQALLPIDQRVSGVVQTISVDATGGTFTITFDDGFGTVATTPALPFNAPAVTVETALQALPSIGAGNVSVAQIGEQYVLNFSGLAKSFPLSFPPVPLVSVNSSGLTGSARIATVALVTTGDVKSFRPLEPLSAVPLPASALNGTWTLTVVNFSQVFFGTIRNWGLRLQTGTLSNTFTPKQTTYGGSLGNYMDQNQNAFTSDLARDPTDIFGMPTPEDGVPLNLGAPFVSPPFDPATLPLIIPGPHQDQIVYHTGTPFNKVVNVPIPDATVGPNNTSVTKQVEVPLTISGAPTDRVLTGLKVRVGIQHSSVGELRLTLVAPDGKSVLLSNLHGGDFPNYDGTLFDDNALTNIALGAAPFNGSFKPDAPLSSFNGKNINGTWKLRVEDTLSISPRDLSFHNGQVLYWELIPTSGLILNQTNNFVDIVFDRKIDLSTIDPSNVSNMLSPIGAISTKEQTIAVSATGGTFTISYSGDKTPALAFDATPATIQSALEALPSIGAGNVSVSLIGGVYHLFFLFPTPPQITTDASLLTGGTQTATVGPFNIIPNPKSGSVAAYPAEYTDRVFRVTFPTQKYSGSYNLVVGPVINPVNPARNKAITDIRGNGIDNSLNAGLDVLRGVNPTNAGTLVSFYPQANLNQVFQPGGAANSTISIPDDYIITQDDTNHILLELTVNHQNIPDLFGTLTAPDGTVIILFDGTQNVGIFGAAAGQPHPDMVNTRFDDFGATTIQNTAAPIGTGPFKPQEPLSQLVGKNAKGTWTLRILNRLKDASNPYSLGDRTGILRQWSLTFPHTRAGTGLGETGADQQQVGFRIFTQAPTNDLSNDVWTAIGPSPQGINGVTGRVGAITIDPADATGNTVYIGAAKGGVWKTYNFLTQDPSGPTWIPLTDLGPLNSLNIGTLVAIPSPDGDPNKTLVIAGTGETTAVIANSNNLPNTYNGVGFLRSIDAGRTWQVIDSDLPAGSPANTNTNTQFVNGIETGLPMDSALRNHNLLGLPAVGQGTAVNKIVYDPTPLNGEFILYAAIDGPDLAHSGIYRSMDSGRNWTQIQGGRATDVILAPGSATVAGPLQVLYAGFRTGFGVNGGVYFTSSAVGASSLNPIGANQGVQTRVNVDNFPNVPVPIAVQNNNTPAGTNFPVILATPGKTNEPLRDTLYQGWVYAYTNNTLYVTKDFGNNWTRVNLPIANVPTLPGIVGGAFPVDIFPSNDEASGLNATLGTGALPGPGPFTGATSIVIDANNPNVIYLGGTGDVIDIVDSLGVAVDAIGGGLFRVDLTNVSDVYAFTNFDFSDPNLLGNSGRNLQSGNAINTLGPGPTNAPVNGALFNTFSNAQYVDPITLQPLNYVNMLRDPGNPFLNPSSLKFTGTSAFRNDGSDIKWQIFGLETGPDLTQTFRVNDVQHMTSMKDPLTGQTRLYIATGLGVYTVVNRDDGKVHPGLGSAQSAFGSRNGNLQVDMITNTAAQPSTLAADVAGALFFAQNPGVGIPMSDPDLFENGNITWNRLSGYKRDVNGAFVRVGGWGEWIATDPSGDGIVYRFQYPALAGGGPGGAFPTTDPPLIPSDFFHVNFQGSLPTPNNPNAPPPTSRTIGLLQAGDNPGTGVGQWDPGLLDLGSVFAINPRDPSGIVMSSRSGRIFRTAGGTNPFNGTGYGNQWFPIGQPGIFGNNGNPPTAPNNAYHSALAFGSPALGDTNLNNFIYAGNLFGRVFVTFNGGGTSWVDITAGLDGSEIVAINPDPTRGSKRVFVLTNQALYFMEDSSDPARQWIRLNDDLDSGAIFPIPGQPGTGVLRPVWNNSSDMFPAFNAGTGLTTLAVDWRYAIPDDPNLPDGAKHPVLYIGGDGGVVRSTDFGSNWTIFPFLGAGTNPIDAGQQTGGYLPQVRVTDLKLVLGNVDPNTGIPDTSSGLNMLVASTYGRGDWAIRIDDSVYNSFVVIPNSGPKVASIAPISGNFGQRIDGIQITFQGTVDPTSVDLADAVSVLDPNGIPISSAFIFDTTPVAPSGTGSLHNVYQLLFNNKIYDLFVDGSLFENSAGRNEKWLRNRNDGQFYIIEPTGQFSLSKGNDIFTPVFLFDPSFYSDITKLTNPATPIALPYTQGGTYTLVFGPEVTDTSGNRMNQNGNTTNGEPLADRFTGTVNFVPNTAPVISVIAPQRVLPGQSITIPFTIFDAETAPTQLTLQPAVSSTNDTTQLVTNNNIAYGGFGGNRTVTITPAAAPAHGSTDITLFVTDPVGLTSQRTFTLIFDNIPSVPVIPPPGDLTVAHSATFIVTPYEITDADDAFNRLVVTVNAVEISQAFNLSQQLRLFIDGSLFQNDIGRNEKWLRSQANGQWYYIEPTGVLNLQNSTTPIAVFDPSYWKDVNKLINPAAPQTFTGNYFPPTATTAGALVLARPTAFVGELNVTITVSDRIDTVQSSFVLDVTNTPPQMTIADRALNPTTAALVLDLKAAPINLADEDGLDNLTHNGSKVYADNPAGVAYQLSQSLGLYFTGNFFQDSAGLGLNEIWLRSFVNNKWYILEPSGKFSVWNGGNSYTQVAMLNLSYWLNPNALTDAVEPPVIATPAVDNANHIITIAPTEPSQIVLVTAFDGAATTKSFFKLTTTGSTPGTSFADQQFAHNKTPHPQLSVDLLAGPFAQFAGSTNAVSNTAAVYPYLARKAFDLSTSLNLQFNSSYFQDSSGLGERWLFGLNTALWYIIEPNGKFSRWEGGNTFTHLATLDFSYWDDPTKLININQVSPAPLLTLATNGTVSTGSTANPTALTLGLAGSGQPGTAPHTLTFDTDTSIVDNFVVVVTATDTIATLTHSFVVAVTDIPPSFNVAAPPPTTIGHTSSYTATVSSISNVQEGLAGTTFSASAYPYVTGFAFQLQEMFQFYTTGDYFSSGTSPKWFRSAVNNGWYTIDQFGAISQWNGGSSFTAVGTLDPTYYGDPTQLFNAQVPNVDFIALGGLTATFTGNNTSGYNLTITPVSGGGDFLIRVKASDLIPDVASRYFKLTVTNLAPTFTVDAQLPTSVPHTTTYSTQIRNISDPDDLATNISFLTSVYEYLPGLAYQLDQEKGFFFTGDFSQNSAGLNEKWIKSQVENAFYIIEPSGRLSRWNGGSSFTQINMLSNAYWTTPSLLYSAQVPPDFTQVGTILATLSGTNANNTDANGRTLTIDPQGKNQGDFMVHVKGTDGGTITSRFFKLTFQDAAPTFGDLPDQSSQPAFGSPVGQGVSHQVHTFTVDLTNPTSFTNPFATPSPVLTDFDDTDNNPSPGTIHVTHDIKAYLYNAASSAYRLRIDQQLFFTGNFFQNSVGLNEIWLRSAATNAWFIVEPTGKVSRWNGGLNFTFWAQLDNSYWADPSRLLNAVEPAAAPTSIVTSYVIDNTTHRVTVNTDPSFIGDLMVKVTASDPAGLTATKFFKLSLTAQAPTLTVTPGGPYTLDRNGTPLQLNLNGSDPDFNDTLPLTYQVALADQGVTAVAYNLDQTNDLYAAGEATNPYFFNFYGLQERWVRSRITGTWYGLTPDGNVHLLDTENLPGPTVAVLNVSYYNDPSRLTNATTPAPLPVTFALSAGTDPFFPNGRVLTLTSTNASFTGRFLVTVTVTNSIGAVATRSFFVEVR